MSLASDILRGKVNEDYAEEASIPNKRDNKNLQKTTPDPYLEGIMKRVDKKLSPHPESSDKSSITEPERSEGLPKEFNSEYYTTLGMNSDITKLLHHTINHTQAVMRLHPGQRSGPDAEDAVKHYAACSYYKKKLGI